MSKVVVVSSDLMARERVRAAAERLGMEVSFARPIDTFDTDAVDVVILDLDELGAEAAEGFASGGARVLGYFSHVDVDLGERAQAAGIQAVRRGRFWSGLDSYLSGS